MLLACVGFINLVWICVPITALRGMGIGVSAACLITIFASGLGKFLMITDYTFPVLITLATCLICTALFLTACYYIAKQYRSKHKPKLAEAKTGAGTAIWNKLSNVLSAKEDTITLEGEEIKKTSKKKSEKKSTKKKKE